MPRCPNCNYILVLLSHRLKYKCAKCSRLFLQKFIENRDFKKWNKFQRKIDIGNLKPKKKARLSEEEKKLRIEKQRKNSKKKQKEYYRENKERLLKQGKEYWKKYYKKNNDEVLLRKKLYNQLIKENRHNVIDRIKYKTKIDYLRMQQVRLAQQKTEFNSYKPSTKELEDSFSTFGLSELLAKPKHLYII